MLLAVKGLKVYFRNQREVVKAIDGIDLDIDENEVVGLVGESGSGKSMTALSIMRLVPQGGSLEGGKIVFEGRDMLSLNESEMLKVRGCKISMIFQEPFTSLNPVMRVGEQVGEVLSAHRSFSKREVYEEVLRLFDKVRMDNPKRIYFDYPHQLSGGQRQRAMIAMALALNPKLLIADEPTTALDVTIQSEILKLLRNLKKEFKMSVLFITHDFGVINEVADRVFVMKDGRIVEQGRKDYILKSPAHPYTRRLLEAIPRPEREETTPFPGKADVLVEIKDISKSFSIERGFRRRKVGEVKAVEGVSLVLRKGRTLGLVGESASGKTTLGRMLLGLTEPDSGKIVIDGKDLKECLRTAPKAVRRMMQIVFQDPYGSLDPRMRMEDIVLEGPTILGMKRPEKEELLKDALYKVKLEWSDRLRFPHQFSGGQRQRIAIARALAVKPKFLVLDEPVSSLDVSIQSDVLSLLRRLQRELGLTYLFISHDLRVVGSMSDEVAVMLKGKIVEISSASSIYKMPQHPYTKRLLESIPSI